MHVDPKATHEESSDSTSTMHNIFNVSMVNEQNFHKKKGYNHVLPAFLERTFHVSLVRTEKDST